MKKKPLKSKPMSEYTDEDWEQLRKEREEDEIDQMFSFGYDPSRRHMDEKDIGSGSWVLIKSRIPVSDDVRPVTYGIYWAIPHDDPHGRQAVKVYTPAEVVLLNYEYTPISEERLQMYREDGYELHEVAVNRETDPLTLSLMEKGRSLCEEEREIIYALQLDGLDERQACEEYFMSHHTDDENIGICWLPSNELYEVIVSVFGTSGLRG